MNSGKFCAYTFIGALPWCYLLAWAGTKLGQHWQQVSAWLHKADAAIVAVLAVLFAVWLWHHLRPDPDETGGRTGVGRRGNKIPWPVVKYGIIGVQPSRTARAGQRAAQAEKSHGQ